ncbi:MAG TPA: hypothetical protein VLA48_08670 [Nitrososphaeraceae archaeon]|nr:hypothetical protein [Nitrososphaeraceae archaeon]
MERVPVTEDNFIQILADYTEWKYEDEIKNSIDECTWDLEFESDEFVYKQLLTWFIFERINPATGKTILDEFIDFVSKDSNNFLLVGKLRMMKNLIYDIFEIVDRKGNIITLKGQSNQKKYKVEIISGYVERYAPGRFVMARIFPWGDYYRFAGITKIKIYHNNKNFPKCIITQDMIEQIQDYFEKRFVKDAESIIISKRSTLHGMLNKLPYVWIDGICTSLLLNRRGKKKEKVKRIVEILVNSQHLNDLVNSFPKDARTALLLIKEKGGIVKYREIVKKYSDDTKFNWEKEPPISPIGLLRRHGLVIVGRMLIGNRFYKAILIPNEILQRLTI